jgi:hypothetical protein
VFFVKAHVFVIDRASLLIEGNRYLGIELPFRAGISGGLSKRARLTPPDALVPQPASAVEKGASF